MHYWTDTDRIVIGFAIIAEGKGEKK